MFVGSKKLFTHSLRMSKASMPGNSKLIAILFCFLFSITAGFKNETEKVVSLEFAKGTTCFSILYFSSSASVNSLILSL